MNLPQRPFGDAVQLSSNSVAVTPDQEYRIAGIYSFGRGLIKRPVINGTKTSYSTLTRIRTGQLAMSKLNAWEGALAIVSEEFSGAHVSPEYPVFDIDEDVAEPSYIAHLIDWPVLWERLTPRGSMVRRKRTAPSTLMATMVPLPDLDEQRRIARTLDEHLTSRNTIASLGASTRAFVEEMMDGEIFQIFQQGKMNGWPLKHLEEIAEINPKTRPPRPNEEISFVPMATIDSKTGTIDSPKHTTIDELGSGYKRFQYGDILWARITPCMQNGKSAIFADPSTEIGAGSSEFHVIRTQEAVLPEWVHRFVRTREFRRQAMVKFTGTAGQQRVPAGYLRAALVPIPKSIDVQRRTISRIDQIQDTGNRILDLIDSQSRNLQNLRISLLNAAFSGRL